jgi:hypothetical protein
MEKEMAHYHPRGKSIITAYVGGVNTYIKEVNANPQLTLTRPIKRDAFLQACFEKAI